MNMSTAFGSSVKTSGFQRAGVPESQHPLAFLHVMLWECAVLSLTLLQCEKVPGIMISS
jgi:hypothetical protein